VALDPFKPRRSGDALVLAGGLAVQLFLVSLVLGGWLLYRLLWGRHLLGASLLVAWIIAVYLGAAWLHRSGQIRFSVTAALVIVALVLTLVVGYSIN
jgi:hypothetical protein